MECLLFLHLLKLFLGLFDNGNCLEVFSLKLVNFINKVCCCIMHVVKINENNDVRLFFQCIQGDIAFCHNVVHCFWCLWLSSKSNNFHCFKLQ